MPKIIVQANQSDSDAGRVTLSERVVATHLQDDHYATQLIERLAWAAIDAERLESPTDREHADKHHGRRPHPQHGPQPPAPTPARQHASKLAMTTKRPIPTTPALDRRRRRSAHDTTDPTRREREHERAAAQWLYAWSYEALRPTGELLAARLTTPAVLRPGRVGRVSPRTRRRQTSPLGLVSPHGE